MRLAKYGMTCLTKTDDSQDCDRPASQCKTFNLPTNIAKDFIGKPDERTTGVIKYQWNWIYQNISKTTAHILEKSLTAAYMVSNDYLTPPKHELPCFSRGDWFDDKVKQKRIDRVREWINEKIKEFGK